MIPRINKSNIMVRKIIILTSLLLSGCGTLYSSMWLDSDCIVKPYSGVIADFYFMSSVSSNGPYILLLPLGIADLPLSTAADTVLLPVTITKSIKCSNK